MGCCHSRIEREEMVSRCRARKRYMKHLVKARQNFSASHSLYLRALLNTGSALLRFAAAEIHHHHAPPKSSHTPPQYPHAPSNCSHAPSYSSMGFPHARPQSRRAPPMSPTSISWTTSTTPSTLKPPPPPPFYDHAPPRSPTSMSWTTSTAASTVKPPPPPPPPRTEGSVWDFWEPFVPAAETEEEWDGGGAAALGVPVVGVRGKEEDTSAAGGSELAMVVSCKSKDLVEIIEELNDYFYKAAESGAQVSGLLEVPSCGFSDPRSTAKVYGEGKSLSPMMWSFGSCRKQDGFGNFGDKMVENNYSSYGGSSTGSHHCTVERLYAWEKKLYQEVKSAHILKIDHERKTAQLRKLELTRGEYLKSEKTKKEVEKLESRMMVASQAIETTSAEIVKIRESELYPQLVELVKGLTDMWRSLYEFHQVQTHIVKQLKYIKTIPSTNPTSEIHRQSTLQLELEVQKWHLSFCHLIKSQRDYIQSLTGWLRLSLFPLSKSPQNSLIYSLSEEWLLAMDRIPDKVASQGIITFSMAMHAIVAQQGEEQKQKKKAEMAFKELEKKAGELRSVEAKYGPYSIPVNSKKKDSVLVKRVKVEGLRAKAEEEKGRHEKEVSVTRAMTMNNLQMGLPHVFEAVTGFANVCIHAYETVYNNAKNCDKFHDVKRLLP